MAHTSVTHSRTRRTRFTLTAALITASTLVLSACGSGSGGDTAKPAELTDSGAAIEQLTVAFPGSLANLYIGQEAGILNYYLAATVQEGLVGIAPDGTLVPALAESWETPDDTTYVFTLRENAKFQNGDPLTPEDVVFSITQAADAERSPSTSFYLTGLASATVSGPNEVTVKIQEPNAAFLTNLTNAGALVVTQQKFWEEHDGTVGTSDTLLMGTGPYEVTEFVPDSHATLERADTWWGEAPVTQEIRIDFIPDENTRLLAAQKGDIDVAFNVPLKQAQQWEKISDGRVEAAPDLSYVGLLFDQNVAPFDDPDVRAAVASSVDRTAIVDKLLRGYGEVASTIMTPESLGQAYNAEDARALLSDVPQHDFDLDRAKELLAQSSTPDGFTAELTYPNTGPQLGTAAQSLAENLKEIGVTLNVREVPIEEWLATIGDGEHGLGFMWYFSTTGDPAEVNGYLLGAGNPGNVVDEEAQRLLTAASTATDPKERAELLVQLEQLNAEQTYSAPLWWGQSLTYFSNTVGVDTLTPFTFLGPWGAEFFAAE